MAHVCRKQELGRVPFGVPEFKVEWHGRPIPHPVTFTRTSHIIAYAEFCGPDNIINAFWGDIVTCSFAALGAVAVSQIVESPVGALPTFKAAFMGCILAKVGEQANQIEVSLSTEQQSGDWHEV